LSFLFYWNFGFVVWFYLLLQTRDTNSHDQEASHEDDKPAVVTSDNLPISTEECSQLSFGSSPLSNNAGETSDVASKMEHSDARYSVTSDFFSQTIYTILTN